MMLLKVSNPDLQSSYILHYQTTHHRQYYLAPLEIDHYH